ncbi:MAG TPA: SGNH/GDSL hydrolase family protein [Pyrinomonadaceae bacterium]|jgi:lysophospholipase L1-like esterase
MARGKLFRLYRTTAAVTLNTLALLLLVNLVLGALYARADRRTAREQAPARIPAALRDNLPKVYPGLNEAEVLALRSEMYERTFVYEPYTEFKEPPYAGKYLNEDAHGFRLSRNQGPWPPDRGRYLTVFLFGGSTTFGFGVPDAETIASHLQELMSADGAGREVRVYNFGRASYYSTQERILFERLVTAGYAPDLAVFIDGLNDFYYYDDRPRHADRFQRLIDNPPTTGSALSYLAAQVPMVRAARSLKYRLARGFRGPAPTAVPDTLNDETYNDRAVLAAVIDRYAANKKIVEAAAAASGSKVVFVWQPIPMYKYDLRYHLFAGDYYGRHAYAKFGYPLMAEFVQRNPLGDNFLWCADLQEHAPEPLYVDITHYSGQMSRTLAEHIFALMKERRLWPVHN